MDKFQDFYTDMREFVNDLKEQIEPPVIISLIFDQDTIQVNVFITDKDWKPKPFMCYLENNDFTKPSDTVTGDILKNFSKYIAINKNGESNAVL